MGGHQLQESTIGHLQQLRTAAEGELARPDPIQDRSRFNPTATLLERTLPAQGFMGTSKAAFPYRLRPQTRDSTWANLVNALK